MDKMRDSIDGVIEESNPVGFWERLREMPLVRRIVAIIDRFLCRACIRRRALR